MDDAAVLKRRGYIMGINLGEGSYAKVKSAYSERLKFNVAVKIIDRKKAPSDFLEKFLPREIEILAMLNHRSIVKTYEIFETSDGKVYIVMELGVQGDLLEFIKTRGALQEDDARKKFHQLSSAIKYCHDLDVVHRDLKCENLLLDKDFNNIKKMLRIQKEHRVNFPRSKHLTGECKDLIYRMLQPDVNRRLHIDEILNHCWVQPKARGLSSGAINKEGESSRATEPSWIPEPGADKKSATKLEPREEARSEAQSETKPQEDTLQVVRQSENVGLSSELNRDTEEGHPQQPSETHT
ncbi:testis-specific serine/threonine-protein kinase 1 [Mus caroli]|uniref:non-specific serine/threonine protein kinase n=1 Tax=Mus caroli TaxID=10089 RepID=A0A6P5R8I2_MUSCR|nr:testis-specific serine/threonine-protein kinase 1 [Mus caroli]